MSAAPTSCRCWRPARAAAPFVWGRPSSTAAGASSACIEAAVSVNVSMNTAVTASRRRISGRTWRSAHDSPTSPAGDQRTPKRRPDGSGDVEGAGVPRDRLGEQRSRHEVGHERLGRRHGDGRPAAEQQREHEQEHRAEPVSSSINHGAAVAGGTCRCYDRRPCRSRPVHRPADETTWVGPRGRRLESRGGGCLLRSCS